MTIQMDGNTIFGTTPEAFTARLDELGVDVIGLNCGMGPNHVLTALEKMRSVTTKPLSAQPNAGLPRDVQGRQFYMGSPEYMAEFSRRFVQAGAKFVGGCCGTTPTHIKLIATAIRADSPRQAAQSFVRQTATVADLTPAEVRSSIRRSAQIGLARSPGGEFVTSVEVLPPKGCDADKTLESIRPAERRRR